MIPEEINSKAYLFLTRLKEFERTERKQKLSGSEAERNTVNLDAKFGDTPSISWSIDYQKRKTNIIHSYGDTHVGFEQEDYKEFADFIHAIQEHYYGTASIDFIEDVTFKWMVEVYKSQRPQIDLIGRIEDELAIAVKEFVFYFPVLNLTIDKPFTVGITEFMFFTEEFWNEYYQNLRTREGNEWSEETFKNIYRNNFQGQVIAKVKFKAEKKRAEEIARETAGYAVDILKFHSQTLHVPEYKITFDLNFRLNYNLQMVYLSQESGTNSFVNSLEWRVDTNHWSKEDIDSPIMELVRGFGGFTVADPDNELKRLILQSMSAFAKAISNWDLHERCTSLITIIESLMLKESDRQFIVRTTKTRFNTLINRNEQRIAEVLGPLDDVYQVRHKMVHKASREEINLDSLAAIQVNVARMLSKLVVLSHHYNEKNALIDFLDT